MVSSVLIGTVLIGGGGARRLRSGSPSSVTDVQRRSSSPSAAQPLAFGPTVLEPELDKTISGLSFLGTPRLF